MPLTTPSVNMQAENSQRFTHEQPDDRQNDQNKTEDQLFFQRENIHQPHIQENGQQNTGVQKRKGIAHIGYRHIEILGDITHDHTGHDNQRTGQRIRKATGKNSR